MTSTLNSILQTLRLSSATKESIRTATPTPAPPHKSFPPAKESSSVGISSGLPEISLAEVAQHDEYTDCWIVIYDRIYDVTSFLRDHPGGEDIILEHAGRDATLAFHGTGHSRLAIEQLGEYLIGELPAKEHIFRNTGAKVLSFGVPQ